MAGRRVCPVCGATYHVVNKPPRLAETSARRRRLDRPDDAPSVIEMRQNVYEDHALPILEYYRTHAADRFRSVNGEQAFDAVYADVLCGHSSYRPVEAPTSGRPWHAASGTAWRPSS